MSDARHIPPADIQAYEAFVLRHQWWNLTVNVLDGAVFAAGMALVPVETVLPGYVKDTAALVEGLGAYENTLVGALLFVISACFMMPQQLWVAHFCERRALLKRPLIVFGITERLPWLVMGILIALLTRSSPRLALGAFFGMVFVWQFTVGLVSPIWQEMVAKVTPVNRRGLLFGVRESLGGLLGLAVLAAANGVMPGISFPANYAALFLAAFAIIMLSWTPLFFLREMPYPLPRASRSLRDCAREARDVLLHDRLFQRYFLCRTVYGLSAVAAASFFSMRAARVMGSEATVDLMVEMAMVIFGTRLVASVFIGPLGDWSGYRVIMALSAATAAASIAAAMLATGAWGFYAAFSLATLSALTFYLGHGNYILELAPLEKRPTYISLDNMAGLPLVAAPFAGGLMADRFGYEVPFAVGIALAAAAAVMFMTVAVEPRKLTRGEAAARQRQA